MAALVNLSTLIFRAQSRSDMINANYVSSVATGTQPGAEWTFWANSAISDFFDKVGQADPERYMENYQFQTAANVSDYPLPSDFKTLLRVDLLYGAGTPPLFYTLRKFNLIEEDAFQFPANVTLAGPAYRYRLRGSNIHFAPSIQAANTISLYYLPVVPQLVPTIPGTTVSAASAGQLAPATNGTINVASTTGFLPSGIFTVATTSGTQTITYTALTSTSFTGCTGGDGVGTMALGATVTQGGVQIAIDGINGWEEMIVLDMAMRALLKENATDITMLQQEYARWEQKIKALAEQRDTSFPECTIDVNRGPTNWGGFTSGGIGGL